MGLISNLGAWIDRKLPDKVVVTEASYQELQARLAAQELETQAQDTRLKNLCKEVVELAQAVSNLTTDVNKLKIGMGFKTVGSGADLKRIAQLIGTQP